MHVQVPLFLTIALLAVTLPVTQGGTDSDSYATSGGVYTDPTGGYTVFACPDEENHCDFLGDGGRDIPFGIGAVLLRNPAGLVQNAVAGVNDDLFGASAAIALCMYDPAGDPTICTPPEDAISDVGCGTTSLIGVPFLSDSALVVVWALFVAEDLNVCGASAGTATATFF